MLIQQFITSEDVCWNTRNVKFKAFISPEMHLIYISLSLSLQFAFCFSYGLKTKTQLHQTRLLKNYKKFPTIESVFEMYRTLLRTSN